MTVLANTAATQDRPGRGPELCVHCATALTSTGERFCCGGCEFVYRTINSLGLQGFYRFRETGDRARASSVVPGKKFEYLNDSELLEKIVSTDPDGYSKIRFYLPTIHCSACVWLLEKLPEVVRGVFESRVSFRSGIIEVRFDSQRISVHELAQVLNSIGYPPVPATSDLTAQQHVEEDRALLRRIGVAAVCAANAMMMADSLAQGAVTGIEEPFRWLLLWASVLITLPAVIYSASPFYRAAFGALVMGRVHLDVPIALAILLSYGAGVLHAWQGDLHVYFDSITCLILLLLVARYVQRRAIHKARASTLTAWDLFPAVVRICRADETIEAPLRELTLGDVVEVRPGERIPADGIVVSGESAVESSFLTGESRPFEVRSGSAVLGAGINVQSVLRVRVEALGEKSRLGNILVELEEAHEKRTVLESRIHSITNAFVSIVLIAALITFVVWYFIDSSRALDIAISLLIVTCPCALGLAIPTALTVALSQAQKLGIFIKNAEALNLLADAEHFYFDKTGTLTEGRLEIQESLGSARELQIAAALAARAPAHPVAAAIARSVAPTDAEAFTYSKHVPGKGMQAELEAGKQVFLGSYKWCRERSVLIDREITERIQFWQAQGASVCLLDEGGRVVAAFKLGDTVRPQAQQFADQLQKDRKKVFILSGDSQEVVDYVAGKLSIPRAQARGELSPEQKGGIVGSDSALTVMIGDGLNDAQAILKSKVGIGVSGGIEATLECADVFLSQRGGADVGVLYAGARKTQRVILRNIAYSVVYNIIGASLAVTGHVTPVFAAILMPLSSLTVVLSSLLSIYFTRSENA